MNKPDIPRRLAEERNKRGYTQRQVAEALGVSDKTYSKWERGVNEMTVETLCRLAEVYGCSPTAFLTESGRELSLRDELAAMAPQEAALCCHEWMSEMRAGMFDSYLRDTEQGAEGRMPAIRPPKTPENPGDSFSEFPGGMLFLEHLGRDVNLHLLLMPSEEGFGWLEAEAEELLSFFSLLRHLPLLAPMLEAPNDGERDYFTPEFLAEKAGLSPGEAAEALAELEGPGICLKHEAATAEGGALYSMGETRLLRAMLALAHLQLPQRSGEEGGGEA